MASVSVVSYHQSVQSILLIINLNLNHTAFCTILESFDGKGCGQCDVPNWYAHLTIMSLAVPTSRASKKVQNAVQSKLRLIINCIDWNDQTKG